MYECDRGTGSPVGQHLWLPTGDGRMRCSFCGAEKRVG